MKNWVYCVLAVAAAMVVMYFYQFVTGTGLFFTVGDNEVVAVAKMNADGDTWTMKFYDQTGVYFRGLGKEIFYSPKHFERELDLSFLTSDLVMVDWIGINVEWNFPTETSDQAGMFLHQINGNPNFMADVIEVAAATAVQPILANMTADEILSTQTITGKQMLHHAQEMVDSWTERYLPSSTNPVVTQVVFYQDRIPPQFRGEDM